MQSTTKLFRSMCGLPRVVLAVAALSLTCLSLSVSALAQSSEVSRSASTATTVIPQQVRYTGALANRTANAVEAVFKIYATAEGGEPLWTETQRVTAGADGSYSVLLGAASSSGLPQSVFAAGQARWVGVSVDGAEEGARSPLSSVAYAMKAGDAESVGGVSAANLATKEDLAKLAVATSGVGVGQVQAAVQAGVQPATNPTGSGTADYVALWTTSGNLGNSGIFQAASGFLGVGTTTPGGPLQLSTGATGGANATMMLTQTSAASGNYYADIGLYNSHGLIGNLSALGAGYPSGNLFVANDVVFLGGQQNAGTNLIFLTNTSGALKFGTGGFAVANERMRIGAAGGVSVGNSYVTTDPGAGNLIVSGKVGVGTTAPGAVLEVNGTAKFDGLVTFASGQTFPGGGGTITGISTTSPLTGSGTSGTVALGLSTSALENSLSGVYAELATNDTFALQSTFSEGLIADQSLGSGYAAVSAQGTSGSIGVYGGSDTGHGVEGEGGSLSGGVVGVFGSTGGGVSGDYTTYSNSYNAGVWGDTAGGGQTDYHDSAGVLGTADNAFGVLAINNSSGYSALVAENSSGDVADFEALGTTGKGLTVRVNNDSAGLFYNTSNGHTTLVVSNLGSGGLGAADKGTPGMFDTLMATSPTGTCGIGGGSMSCTGPVKSLVSTGGSRTVETYAAQSPENWMEDYGSGAMEGGVGVVQVDPGFAETVSGDASYHVFLTPRGDLKSPLYVTNATASSFEVREANGGTSSIGFDYKIVAKRRGYEAQRLVDVTDRFNAVQAEAKQHVPAPAVRGPRSVAGSRTAVRAATMPNGRLGGGTIFPKAPVVAKAPVVGPVVEK
jgi:hypothetical protein